MAGTARTERHALAATLDATDPAAPTLCVGWNTAMLAAHIVLRDRRPDLQIGMLVRPLNGRLATAQQALARTPWTGLVEKVRQGPSVNLSKITVVDDLMNTLEFAVHHEDVRRGVPGWEPITLPAPVSDRLWRTLPLMAKLSTRSLKVPLVFATPDGLRAVLHRGADPVVVTGEPIELALFATGRQGAARVEFTGPPAAVATVRAGTAG